VLPASEAGDRGRKLGAPPSPPPGEPGRMAGLPCDEWTRRSGDRAGMSACRIRVTGSAGRDRGGGDPLTGGVRGSSPRPQAEPCADSGSSDRGT